MVNRISEARLGEVHPKLAERVRMMAQMLEGENITIQVVQGLRSWKEQEALWQQGRDSEGNIIDAKQVVTHAEAGHSYHCFGLAVDVAPFDGGIPDWNASHPAWMRIVAIGESVGLVSGSKWRTFPDWPHFQMTGFLPASPDESIRAAFHHGGITAVWAETGLDNV